MEKNFDWIKLITTIKNKFRLTDNALATRINVSPHTIGNILYGKVQHPRFGLIRKLEEGLSININIETGEVCDKNVSLSALPIIDYQQIREMDMVKIREKVMWEEKLPLHISKGAFGIIAPSDRMEDIIRKGDILMIDTELALNDNEPAYVILKDGRAFVCNLSFDTGYTLWFFNNKYKPIKVEGDAIASKARVDKIIRKL